MFTLTRPLIAQPLASSIGPMVRWRSFNQAITIDGKEIARITPSTTRGSCQAGRSVTLANTMPNAVESAPKATPKAAIVPTSNFLGGGGGVAGTAGGAFGSVVTAVIAAVCSLEVAAVSA